MVITAQNYYSREANEAFMSHSQYKDFCKCEAMALAKIKGEFMEETTKSMLIGSYVDASLLGGLDEFKELNGSSMFTQKGELKAEFKQAEYMIERVKKDEMFMRFLGGNTQKICIGEIAGVPFRGKIDVFHENQHVIVDLKTCADFKQVWCDEERTKKPFVEAWGYDTQLAVYRELCDKQARCFIAAVTKEKEPDIVVMEIPGERLDYCISVLGDKITRFQAIKNGLIKPERCEQCDYCKKTKVLKELVEYTEVGK